MQAVSLERSYIKGNEIRVVNAKLETEDCRFIRCSSYLNGGAIYVIFLINDCEHRLENLFFISRTFKQQ